MVAGTGSGRGIASRRSIINPLFRSCRAKGVFLLVLVVILQLDIIAVNAPEFIIKLMSVQVLQDLDCVEELVIHFDVAVTLETWKFEALPFFKAKFKFVP